MSKGIPAQTIQTVARSIYKEASDYGFGPVDIVRLINDLMDLCKTGSEAESDARISYAGDEADHSTTALQLPLTGNRVNIREFRAKDDRALLQKWLPDRYGRYFVLSCATAQSITVDSLANSATNHLGIVTLKDDKPIGAMAYLDLSETQKRAELRKLIGDPESRGQGLAEEATRLWISYGMQTLGLEKIYVSTLQTHINNIKLNEDIGFKVEGLLRNEVLIDGRRHDVLRMGIWQE